MDDDTFQVVFIKEAKNPLIKWLHAHGMELVQMPSSLMDEDDLPTYIVGFMKPADNPGFGHERSTS
jgi:hypothetical protein